MTVSNPSTSIGEKLSLFSRRPKPPKKPTSAGNRRAKWKSFTRVKWAVRWLVHQEKPVNPREISDATLELFGKRVPEKTITGNEFCKCIYYAFATTKPAIASRARPTIWIAPDLRKRHAAELRVIVMNLRDGMAELRDIADKALLAASKEARADAKAATRERQLAEALEAALKLAGSEWTVPFEGESDRTDDISSLTGGEEIRVDRIREGGADGSEQRSTSVSHTKLAPPPRGSLNRHVAPANRPLRKLPQPRKARG